ncbi:MAG TPA: hypothetical protein VJB16_05560, partial [archaeon]|nr:hypothetical protein [archaeon]
SSSSSSNNDRNISVIGNNAVLEKQGGKGSADESELTEARGKDWAELERMRKKTESREREQRQDEATDAFLPLLLDWAKKCALPRGRAGFPESVNASLIPQSEEAAVASIVEIYSHADLLSTLRRAAIDMSLRTSRSRLDFLRISSPCWGVLVSSCKLDGSVAWLTAELRALSARALRHKFVAFAESAEHSAPPRSSSLGDELVATSPASPGPSPNSLLPQRRNSRPLLGSSTGSAAAAAITRSAPNQHPQAAQPQQLQSSSSQRMGAPVIDQKLMKRASRRLLGEVGNRLEAAEANGCLPIRGLVEIHAQLLNRTREVYGSTECPSRMLVASFFFLRILCPLLVSAAEWLPTPEDGHRQERVREMQLISRYVIKRATDNMNSAEEHDDAVPEELDKYDRRSGVEIARVCDIFDRAAQLRTSDGSASSSSSVGA